MSWEESIPIELISIPNKSLQPAGDNQSVQILMCLRRGKMEINFRLRLNPKQGEERNYNNKTI